MKKIILLIALMLSFGISKAQQKLYTSDVGKFLTNHGVAITGKAFTAATNDTTAAIDLCNYTSFLVTVQTKDIATCLIKYQLSIDSLTWGTLTTMDSLKQPAIGSVVKSVDLTPVMLGARFVRMVFTFSANAYTLGTTTPTYSARYKWVTLPSYSAVNTANTPSITGTVTARTPDSIIVRTTNPQTVTAKTPDSIKVVMTNPQPVMLSTNPDTAYGWHTFSVEDSLVRSTNYTAYSAGQALNDSTGQSNTATSPKVLVFNLNVYYTGWEGQITDLYVTSDSANFKMVRVTLYRDSISIPRTKDGSVIAYKAANLNRRLGSIDVGISGNNSSAAGVGQTTYAGMTFASLLSNQIYGVVEELVGTTPQKNEHYYFKMKGKIKRSLP